MIDIAESAVCRNSALALQPCILKYPIGFAVGTDPSLEKAGQSDMEGRRGTTAPR